MKALLFIVCLLLASTLSFPTSTTARELDEKDPYPENPENPAVKCGRGQSYFKCILKPPPKCTIYERGCNADPTP
ncbi:hypothetical protein F3Y22_tig00110206pilonHSYRG00282 [Hibiscus syriacus]|uniref:Uncharacterized protein n=1 Tax=Hibiscus syriacus TaxID=106335 RepID=A0A6A3BDM3_HIBSY|nr:hypothetical protein F3Y22_tig00110206pilonHSYRG00282 [Hibiscus syriacus]